jgi:hypothetical protein
VFTALRVFGRTVEAWRQPTCRTENTGPVWHGSSVNVLDSSLTYSIIQLSRCTNHAPFQCTRSPSVTCASPHIKLNDFNKTYQTQCLPLHFISIKCAQGRTLYITFLKRPINAVECMNVSLSYSTTNMFRSLTWPSSRW